jgi:hypothetical protein
VKVLSTVVHLYIYYVGHLVCTIEHRKGICSCAIYEPTLIGLVVPHLFNCCLHIYVLVGKAFLWSERPEYLFNSRFFIDFSKNGDLVEMKIYGICTTMKS